VGKRIGAIETSVHRWITTRMEAKLQFLPRLIEFLGFNPFPAPQALGGKIRRQRMNNGVTLAEAATTLGMDGVTRTRWESG
jgi:hypothetical protein